MLISPQTDTERTRIRWGDWSWYSIVRVSYAHVIDSYIDSGGGMYSFRCEHVRGWLPGQVWCVRGGWERGESGRSDGVMKHLAKRGREGKEVWRKKKVMDMKKKGINKKQESREFNPALSRPICPATVGDWYLPLGLTSFSPFLLPPSFISLHFSYLPPWNMDEWLPSKGVGALNKTCTIDRQADPQIEHKRIYRHKDIHSEIDRHTHMYYVLNRAPVVSYHFKTIFWSLSF